MSTIFKTNKSKVTSFKILLFCRAFCRFRSRRRCARNSARRVCRRTTTEYLQNCISELFVRHETNQKQYRVVQERYVVDNEYHRWVEIDQYLVVEKSKQHGAGDGHNQEKKRQYHQRYCQICFTIRG